MQIVGIRDHENQTNRVVVEVDGRNIVLYIKLRYHYAISRWLMSVFDEMENPLVRHIPVLAAGGATGGNLLRQFAHLRIGSAYLLPRSKDRLYDEPTLESLAMEFYLLWGDTPNE